MTRHQGNIFPAFAQRRYPDRHDVEPVKQIFAKPTCADFSGKLAVCRGHDTNVDLYAARPSDPLKSLLLQGADDLALGFNRHVGDLVEKQGAAMRALKGADFARCAVDRVFAAKQLDLEPFRPHRRAVDRDKGALRAPRMQVEEPSRQPPFRRPVVR